MRDDAAPGPMTPASAPISGSPRNRKIPWGESAPARLGREDPRTFGSGTLTPPNEPARNGAHLVLGPRLFVTYGVPGQLQEDVIQARPPQRDRVHRGRQLSHQPRHEDLAIRDLHAQAAVVTNRRDAQHPLD